MKNLLKMKRALIVSMILVMIFISNHLIAQEKKCKMPFKLNVSADFVSRYIWRGMDFGNSPSIQPTLSFNLGEFELGYWGAVALINNYVESDLYMKYSVKGFSLTLYDYYIPALSTELNDNRYSFCKSPSKIEFDTTTGQNLTKYTTHTIEAYLQYKGPEKFPISVLVGTYIYGNDKTAVDSVFTDSKLLQSVNFKNRFSSYIELGYSFAIKENNFDVFVGATPFSSAYSTPVYKGDFAVVNMGVTGYRNIKITEKFDLPLKASVIFNPQASNIFFVLGLTL
jgi:hypothetical protein